MNTYKKMELKFLFIPEKINGKWEWLKFVTVYYVLREKLIFINGSEIKTNVWIEDEFYVHENVKFL